MAIQLFSPGRVVITFNLQRKLAKVIPYSWEEEVQDMLHRHTSGDWGDLGQSGQEINNTAFEKDASIFSTYHTSDGTAVWIITEGNRICTTVMLPEDY
jgi:hypothetical protein